MPLNLTRWAFKILKCLLLSSLIYFYFNFLNIDRRHFIFAFHCGNPQNNGNLTLNILAQQEVDWVSCKLKHTSIQYVFVFCWTHHTVYGNNTVCHCNQWSCWVFFFRHPSYFQWLKQDWSSNHCSEVIFETYNIVLKYRIGNKEKHQWKIHPAQHQSNYKSHSQRQQTWKEKIYLKCYCWIYINLSACNRKLIIIIIIISYINNNRKAFVCRSKNTVKLFSVSESQCDDWRVLLWCHFFLWLSAR